MSYIVHKHLSCPRCKHNGCFTIYSDGTHCFSCKYTSSEKYRDLFLEKTFPEKPETAVYTELPPKVSLSIDSLIFLEKRGINAHLRFRYGIYEGLVYNHVVRKTERRLVLPFWCDGKMLGYQARALDDQHPKYLGKLFFNNMGKIFYARNQKTDTIVVVEDILSAIRIAKFTHAVAIVGTSLDSAGFQLDKIRSFGPRNFIIWLDGDDAGMRAAVKLKKQLLFYGKVNVIYTRSDPKNLSDRELKEKLFISGCFQRNDIRATLGFTRMASTL